MMAFEIARKEINRFTSHNVIFLAGNHDYGYTGYVL